MVVTANLEELYDYEDRGHPGDLHAFVRRAVELTPAPPDVVLLQEVVAGGARTVTRALQQDTGNRFALAASPPATPYTYQDTRHEVVRDTAIILNLKTMRRISEPGFVKTKHPPAVTSPAEPKNKAKEHAHVLMLHKPSQTLVAAMSVHLAPKKQFNDENVAADYRARWARGLCRHCQRTYPKAKTKQVRIIGGDFNNARCPGGSETRDCTPTAMWVEMTERYGLHDAVFEIHGGSDRSIRRQHRRGNKQVARIDYIFTDATVLNGEHDIAYDAQPGAADYYSDHRFVWAELDLR